jgi:membrane associated rhomboid family serine protease
LEQNWNTSLLIALYVLAIIISDLPTLFKHKNNPGYNSLGASGAVSAVIFACILFDPLSPIYMIPGFIVGILYVVYSYISAKRSNDGINHDAHLFGGVFGMLFCIVLYPGVIEIFIRQISGWSLFN